MNYKLKPLQAWLVVYDISTDSYDRDYEFKHFVARDVEGAKKEFWRWYNRPTIVEWDINVEKMLCEKPKIKFVGRVVVPDYGIQII